MSDYILIRWGCMKKRIRLLAKKALAKAVGVESSFFQTIYRCFLSKRKPRWNTGNVLLVGEFPTTGGTRVYLEMIIAALESSHNRYWFVENVQNRHQNSRGLKGLTDKATCRVRYDFTSPFRVFRSILALSHMVNRKRITYVVASEGSNGLYLPVLSLPVRTVLIEHTVPWGRPHRDSLFFLNTNWKAPKVLVAVSGATAAGIRKYWSPEDTSHCNVLHCRILSNSGTFKTLIPGERTRPLRKTVICVGHVVDYRNPDDWLAVARVITSAHRDCSFVWVGEGPLLSRLAPENDGRIRFMGAVEHEKLEEVYKSAWLYLSLTQKESFGLAVADAMNFGLPCVVSDVGGLPELVTDGDNGFIVDCVEEAVEKIERLYADEDLYARMSAKAQVAYFEKFTREQWNKRFLSLFSEDLP